MLALMDADGNIAWSGEYDEWGNQLNEENPHHLHQPYRLPGQQYDKESGLYYNRNRYYDPLQGRYITQDPIGLEGGWSLYAYPLNPVNGIDPLGLSPADVALIRRKDQLNHQRAWDIFSDKNIFSFIIKRLKSSIRCCEIKCFKIIIFTSYKIFIAT